MYWVGIELIISTGKTGWQTTEGKRTTLQVDERNDVVVDPERRLYDLWNN